MKFIECQQGTPEWLQARAGAITAICFADALSVLTRASGERKAGDFSAASDKYAANVAIERISGKPSVMLAFDEVYALFKHSDGT